MNLIAGGLAGHFQSFLDQNFTLQILKNNLLFLYTYASQITKATTTYLEVSLSRQVGQKKVLLPITIFE